MHAAHLFGDTQLLRTTDASAIREGASAQFAFKCACLNAGQAAKIHLMKKVDLGPNEKTKRTRKREFLDEMNRMVPWALLVDLVRPHAPEGRRGRPPFAPEVMLRIHFIQQWFTLSDPAMEQALHDIPLFREFAGLGNDSRLPDETTILRFRRLLVTHELLPQMIQLVVDLLRDKGLMLRAGTAVDATLISSPATARSSREASAKLRRQAGQSRAPEDEARSAMAAPEPASHRLCEVPLSTIDEERTAGRRPARGVHLPDRAS